MHNLKVGILGSTGYAGIELFRLLLSHEKVGIIHAYAHSQTEKDLTELYPHLKGQTSIVTQEFKIERALQECDVLFSALPHDQYLDFIPAFMNKKIPVIDLGSSFRLQKDYSYLNTQVVYALPELKKRSKIKKSGLIANPGCYATACLLASVPLLNKNLVFEDSIIFDAKSGISGAGKSLNLQQHYCEINENIVPYKLAGEHRHILEIEQELNLFSKIPVEFQFSPQMVPLTRGILVTSYFRLKKSISEQDIFSCFEEFYKEESFIRLQALGKVAQLKTVQRSQFCDLSIHLDSKRKNLIVVSVIDNLLKGASGQAVQNMNIKFNFEESIGLKNISSFP